MACCGLLWTMACLLVIFVICMYKRIKLAIAIIKATSEYIEDVKSILLVPFVFVFVYLIFYAFFVSGLVGIYSKGNIRASTNPDNFFPVVDVTDDIRTELAYFVF